MTTAIPFTNNPAASSDYIEIIIDCEKVFKSWRSSLYSFEWVNDKGRIKALDELNENEAQKRTAIEDALKKQTPIEKPVLGFGMLDAIEIGSGRAAFLTLYDRGLKSMPVHIKKSAEKDFKDFLSKPA